MLGIFVLHKHIVVGKICRDGSSARHNNYVTEGPFIKHLKMQFQYTLIVKFSCFLLSAFAEGFHVNNICPVGHLVFVR